MTSLADGTYSAVGLGGNFLTVLPGVDAVLTVLADPGETSMTNDDYQALVADVAAALI
jgi:hypothetical protein